MGWLTNRSDWKKEEQKYTLFPNTLEEENQWRVTAKVVQVKVSNFLGQITGKLLTTSSISVWRNEYTKTVRFFAMANRWRRSKHLEYKKTPVKEMSSQEYAEAERRAIRLMQAETYSEEIKLLKKGKRIKTNNLAQMKLY